MGLQKLAVVHGVNHVAGSNYHIGIMHSFNAFHVFHESCDIIVVIIIVHSGFGKQDMQFSSFGVDVVMTACSQMFCKGTRFSADIYLYSFNSAVAHIGNRKIDYTVASQKGKGTDGTVGLQAFHPNVSAREIYNSKCTAHIIHPPLHVLQSVQCVRCQHFPP